MKRRSVPKSSPPRRCHHCKRLRRTHKKGLCWTCYTNPEIHSRYPQRQGAREGLGLKASGNPPAEPTAAPPGSAAKMAVLHERCRRGLSLFHPDDNRTPEPLPPETDDDEASL